MRSILLFFLLPFKVVWLCALLVEKSVMKVTEPLDPKLGEKGECKPLE
jgi:hypothetical protein